MKNSSLFLVKLSGLAMLLLAALLVTSSAKAEGIGRKKIVLIAGTPSHGAGEHEFRSGMLLIKKWLDAVPEVQVVVYTNGWPQEPGALNGARSVVLYMDGGEHHAALQEDHLQQLSDVMKSGCGFACLHYAVEVPTNHGAEWLEWMGGYFEAYWSINPTWTAEFKTLPEHPITRGVKPFTIKDEWYYHMRFQEKNVTPILTAVPPDSTRGVKDDPHGSNPAVRARKGMPEVMAWAYDRPDGGRGFGFTGAHYNHNWANDDFRKLILNAIVWTAHAEVPADGIQSSVTQAELDQNLDPKGKKKH